MKMKTWLVFFCFLLLTGKGWAVDYSFNWQIPSDSLTTYHEICWGQTYTELEGMSHCTNVGFNTGLVNGVSRATGTVYNLTSGISYFFAARACSFTECSELCEPIYVDANPSTTYNLAGDYDGDGVADRIYRNSSGQIMIDWSANGFLSNGAFDEVLAGYGDATYTPLGDDVDDDGDGILDIALQDAYGNIYIDHSSNGFHGWDEVLILNKFNPYVLWISGHGATSNNQFLADVNGDGKNDSIVYFSSTGEWYVSLSDGIKFLPYSKWISGHGVGSAKQLMADVNGDGKSDAVVFFSDGKWYVATAKPTSGFNPYTLWISGHGASSNNQFLSDVNGDGKNDSIAYFASTGEWYVSLSDGIKFLSYSKWISGHGVGSAKQLMADVNGDGKSDAVVFFSDGKWYVALSN